MSDSVFPPPKDLQKSAHITSEKYASMYAQSVNDPDGFWKEIGKRITWFKDPAIIKNSTFNSPVSIKWYEDGILNASYNCIDRHLPHKANDVALIWESDDPTIDAKITYAELKDEVCRLANALKSRGVKKGDRVTIYMPMIPQAVYAMLACARIGAIHSVVFGGFSPTSLIDRITDCKSDVVITSDEGMRGGKSVPLKANVDEALKQCPDVHTVIVFQRTGNAVPWNAPPSVPPQAGGGAQNKSPRKRGDTGGSVPVERDVWWHDIVAAQSPDCEPEHMNAEDPLFILYTSGSTGKPKGVLHTTGGYMVFASFTHECSFDYKPGDIYWCTADVGWVTGHSYIVYGPLANGATSLIFEGVPQYPDWGRFWQVVDKHKVNIFYTAPTAIRALMKAGDGFVTKASRKSLRILGTVGEPINAEAWHWYNDVVGEGRCPIVDTWWQTETGGHLITPMPGATTTKPGSATFPFFGVKPLLVDTEGKLLEGTNEGALCIADSWPGMMRTVFGDHARFEQTYFSTFPGKYFTGDGARRDEDGYYWITGRMDDVINVSGHRFGTAQIESAINEDVSVVESAVVGFPHDLKGQGIYAYVTLAQGAEPSEEVRKSIVATVRRIIGPIASPDMIQWAPGLPKTRSGKIMRRILRKIAAEEFDTLGDTSTLADPAVVEDLIKGRKSS